MTKGIYKRVAGDELKARIAIIEQLQALPLDKKVKATQNILKKALKQANGAPICLLYSGGKDSTVLLNLTAGIINDPIVMYNNTGLAEPSLLEFIRNRTRGLDYVETMPDQDAFTMWQNKGYWPIFGKRTFTGRRRKSPGLVCSPVQCCFQLKEAPANRVMKERGVKVVLWGNRADESGRRKLSFCDSGIFFQPKKYPWMQCYPIMFWTRQDILDYLAEVEPDYPHSISQEAGCWACCTDITHKPNNIQRLYAKDKVRFNRMIRAGFGRQILIAKGISDPDEDTIEQYLRLDPAFFLKV